MGFFDSIGHFFGDIGHDISGAFNWAGKEAGQLGHWLSNPVHDLEALGGAAAIALPFLAPEILGGLGAAGGLAEGLGGGLGGLLGGGAAAGDVALGSAEAVTAADIAAAGGVDATGSILGLTADAAGGALTGGTGTALDAFAALQPAEAAAGVGGGAMIPASLPGVGDIGAGITSLAAEDTAAGLGGAAGAAPGGGFLAGLTANPLQTLGLGLGGAGIAAQLARMGMGLPYENQLKAGAGQAGAVAAQDFAQQKAFTDPLRTGNLPAPWEAAVQNSFNQAKDAIASKYASMGISNSTSEAGDIAALTARLPEIRMQIAQGLATVGMSYGTQALAALGLEDSIYTSLMDANIRQDQALAQSIAGFAGAAGRSQAVRPTGTVV